MNFEISIWTVLLFFIAICLFIYGVYKHEVSLRYLQALQETRKFIEKINKEQTKKDKSFRPIQPKVMWEKILLLSLETQQQLLRNKCPDWDEERIKSAITAYKKFLYLHGTQDDDAVVPTTSDADLVWMLHILSSQQYEKDCIMLFNEYLYRCEAESVTRGYGKGNSKTDHIYRKTFSPPKNTPSFVHVEYSMSDGESIPWELWWSAQQKNGLAPKNYTYNQDQHRFDLAIRDTVTREKKGGGFFSDD